MIRNTPFRNDNPGWMLALSLAVHLLLFSVCTNVDFFNPDLKEAPSYYVDLVDLPSLTPSSTPNTLMAPTQATATAQQQVIAPTKPAAKALIKSIAKQSPSPAGPASTDERSAQEASEFAERLKKLEHASGAKHQAAAVEALKHRSELAPKPVSVSAAGSDYGRYIQSRLRDALSATIVYRSRQPETTVHIYLDHNGKLIRSDIVNPSPDKLFNDSVLRAIEKAKSGFPPPPNGKVFDRIYVFSPEEVLVR